MKLGDAVSAVATPIARALDLPCIDPETNDLRPESPCAKRKAWLNDLSDTMYDTFWPTTSNMETTPKQNFVVNKQIAIEADSPEDAVARIAAGEGKTLSLSVNKRPTAQARPPQPALGARPAIQPAK